MGGAFLGWIAPTTFVFGLEVLVNPTEINKKYLRIYNAYYSWANGIHDGHCYTDYPAYGLTDPHEAQSVSVFFFNFFLKICFTN